MKIRLKTEAKLFIQANSVRGSILSVMKTFGMVDAERFISMIKRDNFDYTEWRRDLWNDMTIEEVFAEAVKHERKQEVTVD